MRQLVVISTSSRSPIPTRTTSPSCSSFRARKTLPLLFHYTSCSCCSKSYVTHHFGLGVWCSVQCLLVPTHAHTRLTRHVANMTCLERLLATQYLCDPVGMLCPGIQGRIQGRIVLEIRKALRLGIQGRPSQTGEGKKGEKCPKRGNTGKQGRRHTSFSVTIVPTRPLIP